MIIFGLLLCAVSIPMVIALNSYDITKKKRRLLHFLMFLISVVYVFLSFSLKIEPYVFEDIDGASDYLIYFSIIFMTSPFLWVNLYYLCRKIFKSIRVYENSKIKTKEQFHYYREDLEKISPGIVAFTYNLENDIRKSVVATILKLKSSGFIQEKDGKICKTNKNEDSLLMSEKMVLSSLKTEKIDTKKYAEVIKDESISMGFVRKNRGGIVLKVIKILVTIIIPIVLLKTSTAFDKYVFDKYKIYTYGGKSYVSVENGEIGDIHFGSVENIDDYYHGVVNENGKEIIFYDKALIRMNKYEDSFILIANVLHILNVIFLTLSVILLFVFIFLAAEQIIYFNKKYIRTIKGNDLLNKAHALKNYLKDFSIIDKRTEEELVLWEYYLIYAVILGVNVEINDKIIEKYFNNYANNLKD